MQKWRPTQAKYLNQEKKERFFVNLYLRGAIDASKIADCEKRACLKPGEGAEIVKRPEVQQRIKDIESLLLEVRERQAIIAGRKKR